MNRPLAAASTAAIMVAITFSGCGDSEESAETTSLVTGTDLANTTVSLTTTVTTSVATTTTVGDLASPTSVEMPTSTPASVPAPASYSEVEADYSASVAATLAQGREALDLLLDGGFEEFHARLGPLAALLSIEDLESGLEELASQAPLGARRADRAIQLGSSLRVYRAEVEWGDAIISVTVVFDDAWAIADLALAPQGPLPDDPAGTYESRVLFHLPFDGLWFVFWGGDIELQNYHVVAQDQRHALDLVVWNDGGTHRGDGTANEDYWAYGQRVLAPAGGTVVTAVDGLPDNLPQVGRDPANPAGNHVVIRVADEEYVLIAHMRAGSVTVSEGDTVEQGQQIGLVGNSGNTSEPHIHIHLQDKPTFDPSATGLPLVFSSYLANGHAVERGELIGDQFVANS